MLKEAGITGKPRRALIQAFPTMDDLLSASFMQIAALKGVDPGTPEALYRDSTLDLLWRELERRWRFDATSVDRGPREASAEFQQLLGAIPFHERSPTLREFLQLRATQNTGQRSTDRRSPNRTMPTEPDQIPSQRDLGAPLVLSDAS